MSEEHVQIFKQYNIDTSNAVLYKGKGCDVCRGSGYKGRVGIHELLVMDDDIRRLLLSEVAAGPIREMAKKNGMRTLLEDGLVKVTMGLTTLEEVLATAQ